MNRTTSQVVRTCCAALLAVGLGGCKKEEAPPPKPVEETKAPEPVPKPPEPPKPYTPEESAKAYQDCWGKFNAKAWDDFKKCFAKDVDSVFVDSPMPPAKSPDEVIAGAQVFTKAFPDVVGEPQLILVNGKTVAGVWLIKGTNTGPMTGAPGSPEMPPTGKKIGQLMGHIIEWSDANETVKERNYVDMGTMMGQLGLSPMPVRAPMEKGAASPTVVIAKDDETEKKNLEAAKAHTEIWNKHDVKAITDTLADDVKWSEQAMATDQDKKSLSTGIAQMWKAFSDVKLTTESAWAAGDYVVQTGRFQGTNDGDMPGMKLKKTGKKVDMGFLRIDRYEAGKIKETWLWYDSTAFAGQLGLLPPPGAAPGGKDEKGAPGKDDKAAPAKGGKAEKAPG